MNFTLPKKFSTLSKDEQQGWMELKNIINQLSKEYLITKTNKPILRGFTSLQNKQKLNILQSYTVKREESKFTLCVIEFNTSYNELSVRGGSIKTNSHKYLIGFNKSSNNYGNAYLRPESIADKISELFEPVELDIDGFKKFNKKYFLLANNKEKFRNAIKPELLDFLTEIDNLEMEFNKTSYIFRLNKAIDIKQTKELFRIGTKISELL